MGLDIDFNYLYISITAVYSSVSGPSRQTLMFHICLQDELTNVRGDIAKLSVFIIDLGLQVLMPLLLVIPIKLISCFLCLKLGLSKQ